MKAYQDYSTDQLTSLQQELQKEYAGVQALGLNLDMSRGKPSPQQVSLSAGLLTALTDFDDLLKPVDSSNYGVLEGLPEARELMGELLGLPAENVFVGGSASLNLMHDCMSFAYIHGVRGGTPWSQQPVKFLCPVPGYDRHFNVAKHFGFELVPVEMDENGPHMDAVEQLVKDENVKGIWCVPKYSNPTGITYSDEVVRRLAQMDTAAEDFLIFWDNAYAVHHLDADNPDQLLDLQPELEKAGHPDRGLQFCSTSKITFPGGGISAVGTSAANMAWIREHMALQIISYDKVNQLRHVRFLSDLEGIKALMKEHAQHLKPRFDQVLERLDSLQGLGIAQWEQPKGGYFISLDVLDGCAKRVVELCANAGVIMTPAGATHPHGEDPNDRTIRIAPSFPNLEELDQAAQLLCLSVRLAATEKLLADR